MATAGADGRIRIWNLQQSDLPPVILSNTAAPAVEGAPVFNLAFGKGDMLASAGADGRIVLWDVRTRLRIKEPLDIGSSAFSLAFSHSGDLIAAGKNDGSAELWSVEKRTKTEIFSAHGRDVFGIAFSRDDTKIAAASLGKGIIVQQIDRSDLRLVGTPAELSGDQFYSVAFLPDGSLVTGSGSGAVSVWDLGPHPRLRAWEPREQIDNGAVFADDGRTLVSFVKGGAKFRSTEKLDSDQDTVPLSGPDVRLLIRGSSNRYLATVDQNDNVTVWDLSDRHVSDTVSEPGLATIFAGSFETNLLGNAELLALAGRDTQKRPAIKLFSSSEMKRMHAVDTALRLEADLPVTALALNVSRNLLAFAQGKVISIYNLVTAGQQEIETDDSVTVLAFSTDGSLLAWGSHDHGIHLHRTGTDANVAMALIADGAEEFGAQTSTVKAVAFSPDGSLMASGDEDGRVILWNIDEFDQIGQPIVIGDNAVTDLSFSRDGRWLLSGDSSGSIRLVAMDMRALSHQACDIASRNLSDSEWGRFFGDRPRHITCPEATAREADGYAISGDTSTAARLFNDALGAALEIDDRDNLNDICWLGSLDGFAKLVAPACDRAAQSAGSIWGYHLDYIDSRGVERALVGDVKGAISDFSDEITYITEHPQHDPRYDAAYVGLRKSWIKDLESGRTPFADKELLRQLRLN